MKQAIASLGGIKYQRTFSKEYVVKRNLFMRASTGVLVLLLMCCVLMISQTAAIGTVRNPLGVTFVNVAAKSGITSKTIYGDEHKNRYLLETTGSGAAFID